MLFRFDIDLISPYFINTITGVIRIFADPVPND